MTITLHRIYFNHKCYSPDPRLSALNIRKNKDEEIFPYYPIPEYDVDIPRSQSQSCATYSIRETLGSAVFVRLWFRIPEPAALTYEVKADGGGIIGSLGPFQVSFTLASTRAIVDVPLSNREFSRVGKYDITWNWYYRVLGGTSWVPLTNTSHRIYLILRIPPNPWTIGFAQRTNPWTDLLEECCSIANGTTTENQIVKRITKRVYSNYQLRYDVVGGAPRYYHSTHTNYFLNLTNWIQYVIQGNPPNTTFCNGTPEQYNDKLIVNCYDCAATVTIMSKILGAAMEYYYHGPFGYLNYVKPIGRGTCNNPFYGCSGTNVVVGSDDPRTRFGNHAYTKLNQNLIYDACMKEVLSFWKKLILIIIWIFTGMQNDDLLDRIRGWLTNYNQNTYNEIVIDDSATFEANSAGYSSIERYIEITT